MIVYTFSVGARRAGPLRLRPLLFSLVFILVLLPVVSFGSEITGKIGQWIDVPIEIPEGKIGGGDFYTLSGDLTIGDDRPFEFKETVIGASFKFKQPGNYTVLLTINHVTKSSCAGVSVTPHREFQILVAVDK